MEYSQDNVYTHMTHAKKGFKQYSDSDILQGWRKPTTGSEASLA